MHVTGIPIAIEVWPDIPTTPARETTYRTLAAILPPSITSLVMIAAAATLDRTVF